MSNLDVQSEMRIKEQLTELIQTYGLTNVKTILEESADEIEIKKEIDQKNNNESKIDLEVEQNKKQYIAQTEEEKEKAAKLPDNAKTVEELEQKLKEFPPDTQVRENILVFLKDFINNAKIIMSGKKVSEEFVMALTSRDLIEANTPEEDWIKYNIDIIRKKLKRKLRPLGYNFLDTFWEVGRKFDPKVHNCVQYETVGNPVENGRVTKVLNEGIVINDALHINANVVVGKYTPQA